MSAGPRWLWCCGRHGVGQARARRGSEGPRPAEEKKREKCARTWPRRTLLSGSRREARVEFGRRPHRPEVLGEARFPAGLRPLAAGRAARQSVVPCLAFEGPASANQKTTIRASEASQWGEDEPRLRSLRKRRVAVGLRAGCFSTLGRGEGRISVSVAPLPPSSTRAHPCSRSLPGIFLATGWLLGGLSECVGESSSCSRCRPPHASDGTPTVRRWARRLLADT